MVTTTLASVPDIHAAPHGVVTTTEANVHDIHAAPHGVVTTTEANVPDTNAAPQGVATTTDVRVPDIHAAPQGVATTSDHPKPQLKGLAGELQKAHTQSQPNNGKRNLQGASKAHKAQCCMRNPRLLSPASP